MVIIILLLYCLLFPGFVSGQTSAPLVWVEDGMTRVLKTDQAKTANSITLYTAKREYEPFQIVIKAPGAAALSNVNVTVSDLTGTGNAKISNSNITLYREYYVYVTQGSAPSSGSNKPQGPGWYPDALIPFTHPVTRQDLSGALDAAPFSVSAGQNQQVWIDIYVPPDTPSGIYQGTVTVASSQGNAALGITLNVWNFTLPLIKSLHAYTETDTNSRINLPNQIEVLKHGLNPRWVDPADERYLMESYGLSMVNAYDGGSDSGYGQCTPVNQPPSLSDIQADVVKHQPGLYLYNSYANEVWLCTAQFPVFMQWAAALRAAGVHPDIVTYPVPALMGTPPDYLNSAGDVWSVLPKHYDNARDSINALIDKGIQIWSYNPLTQDAYSPKQTIDFLPINARIMHGFINQSLRFTGTKFWRVDYWTSDPWNNKELYRTEAPGEGDMTYRGDEVGLPGQIIAGSRLKWFREGSEDYEYIQILKNLGQTRFALDTVHTVATDFHTWTQDKNVLLNARKTLGNKINEISSGASPVPPSPTSPNPSPTFPPGQKPGDANRDGKVDGLDYVLWLNHYNQPTTKGASDGDFNNDNISDGLDYVIWLNNYNR